MLLRLSDCLFCSINMATIQVKSIFILKFIPLIQFNSRFKEDKDNNLHLSAFAMILDSSPEYGDTQKILIAF